MVASDDSFDDESIVAISLRMEQTNAASAPTFKQHVSSKDSVATKDTASVQLEASFSSDEEVEITFVQSNDDYLSDEHKSEIDRPFSCEISSDDHQIASVSNSFIVVSTSSEDEVEEPVKTAPSTESDETTNSPGSKRRIAFGDIIVHEFPPAIGDNPSVSGGVPITLSYRLDKTLVVGLDEYENTRRPRRSRKALFISERVREAM